VKLEAGKKKRSNFNSCFLSLRWSGIKAQILTDRFQTVSIFYCCQS
jgi:hypothetical protein